MIDTIHLCLDDLKIHAGLINYLDRTSKIDMTSAPAIKQNIFDKKINYGMINFNGKRQFIGMKRTGKILNSRNSFITYIIDENKDRIMFNVSLPKYYFKNNIEQYLYGRRYPKFTFESYSKFERQKNEIFNLFIGFINDFTKRALNNYVRFEHLYLHRIDFCYNYFAENEQDKFDFINQIKLNKISKLNQTKNYLTSSLQDSTVFWHSRNQSFKVYSKYEEFKSNDFKHLEDRKKASYLLSLSKRIARFEQTLRHVQLQNVYARVKYRDNYNGSLMQYYNKYQYLLTLDPEKRRKLIKNYKEYQIAWLNRKNYDEFTKVKKIYFKRYREDDYVINRAFFNELLDEYHNLLKSFFSAPKQKKFFSKNVQMAVDRFANLYEQYGSYQAFKHMYSKSSFYRLRKYHMSLNPHDQQERILDYAEYFRVSKFL